MSIIQSIYIHYLILLLISSEIIAQLNSRIVINEFMAFNISSVKDPLYAGYPDWIELYNNDNTDFDLNGCFLTDDPTNQTKWQINNTTIIEANEFKGFFADGRDMQSHTNFKLSKLIGYIGLFDKDTLLIDSINYSVQYKDISYGRDPENLENWYFFESPTPGKMNSTEKFVDRAKNPLMLPNDRFFESDVSIQLNIDDPDAVIYYTTDGTVPNKSSSIYSEEIIISETSVVKARSFKEYLIGSEIISNTYFIDEQTILPIFSISTDPNHFFDDKLGIYVEGTNGITGNCSNSPKNWNQDWEREIHLEFFESDKTIILEQDAGIKINGGCSRIYPQKSLAIFAREQYGLKSMQHIFFKDRNYNEYNSIILRSSAQDWWRTMFRDGMIQTLFKSRLEIDYQEYRPSIVFLNGEYYGIHNIREKLNKHYISNIHEVAKDKIDLIEISKEIKINEGDRIAYDILMNYVSKNDLSIEQNYNHVKSLMEIDEYIDYCIAEIYSANADWPGSNMKMWREKKPSGKWRWMIYDLDFGFGGNAEGQYDSNTLALATAANGPDWPNPPWSTLLLRKLLENESFKNEFIQRFALHMSTTFNPARVNNVIDSLQAQIAAEMPRHKLRWERSISFGDSWQDIVEIMREFARKRPQYVREHFSEKFDLHGTSNLTINIDGEKGGSIFFYNEFLTDTSYSAVFFNNSKVILIARPRDGYKFIGWAGVNSSNEKKIEFTLIADETITAIFQLDTAKSHSIVINEINYNSSSEFNSKDWIELVNASDNPINIGNWQFKDSVDTHIFEFPYNTILQPAAFIVLCQDTSVFKFKFPQTNNCIGNFNFGLNNGGEFIRLYDELNFLIDSVYFSDVEPWPTDADGGGHTLELKDYFLDNSLPENWILSESFGTPGTRNDLINIDKSENNDLFEDYFLSQNYPNPFNSQTLINFSIPQKSHVLLKVYDILGNEISTPINEIKEPGNYDFNFDANEHSSGVYIYQLRSGDYLRSRKMLFLK